MTFERRFAASYRSSAGENDPGLLMDDLGQVWAIGPDGTRTLLVATAAVDWEVVGDADGPPFLNGFENAPGDWAPCRYRYNLNSIVYVEGVVARDAPLDGEDAPVPIFQLPANAVPGGDLEFTTVSGNSPSGPTISTILVTGDGVVSWGGYVTIGEGAESHLSLCFSFSMEQAMASGDE